MPKRAVPAGGASSPAPVSLVTGANRGIGFETCRQLARLGHVVVLTARSERSAADAAGRLAGDGVQVHPVCLDVADRESAAAAAAEVGERFGRLDVLVNNAAINYDPGQLASRADLAVARAAMDTNFFGAWQVALAFLPLLRRSAHPRIVSRDRHGRLGRQAGRARRLRGRVGRDVARRRALRRLLPRRASARLVGPTAYATSDRANVPDMALIQPLIHH